MSLRSSPCIRGRVLGKTTGVVLFGDEAYHDKQLPVNLLDRGVEPIVEPKKNFNLSQRNGFLERSLRLYQKSTGLWNHTFRYHKKMAVEHVFGLVKLRTSPLRSHKLKNKNKNVLTAFLLYNNLNLRLKYYQNEEN